MNIRHVDLNLFKVFDAVMQKRSVTGAAEELCLSPSAVSHSLGRLRQAFDDDLFVSKGGSMQPTRRALELKADIVGGMSRFAATLASKDFEPAKAARTFRIAAGDYFTTVVFPRLVAKVLAKAPGINFKIFPCNRLDVVTELDEGHIDFALGWFGSLPGRMIRKTIAQEEEALAVRANHPLLGRSLTIDLLLSYPRVVVELSGSEDISRDGFHHERGVSRRVWIERLIIDQTRENHAAIGGVAVTVPYFAAVAPILQATDMVATLPKRLALLAVEQGLLALLDSPYPPASVGWDLIFQQQQENDQGLKWIIQELIATMQEIDRA